MDDGTKVAALSFYESQMASNLTDARHWYIEARCGTSSVVVRRAGAEQVAPQQTKHGIPGASSQGALVVQDSTALWPGSLIWSQELLRESGRPVAPYLGLGR